MRALCPSSWCIWPTAWKKIRREGFWSTSKSCQHHKNTCLKNGCKQCWHACPFLKAMFQPLWMVLPDGTLRNNVRLGAPNAVFTGLKQFLRKHLQVSHCHGRKPLDSRGGEYTMCQQVIANRFHVLTLDAWACIMKASWKYEIAKKNGTSYFCKKMRCDSLCEFPSVCKRSFAQLASFHVQKKIKHIIQNDDSAQQLCRRSLAILRPGLSRKNLEPKGGRTKVQSFMNLDTWLDFDTLNTKCRGTWQNLSPWHPWWLGPKMF